LEYGTTGEIQMIYIKIWSCNISAPRWFKCSTAALKPKMVAGLRPVKFNARANFSSFVFSAVLHLHLQNPANTKSINFETDSFTKIRLKVFKKFYRKISAA
jgi:hypothetical protein